MAKYMLDKHAVICKQKTAYGYRWVKAIDYKTQIKWKKVAFKVIDLGTFLTTIWRGIYKQL